MIQKMKNRKGFTLIEMLVVIAIIAVLVAIVIPVVGDSTTKAKEAADAANIRSAIAEVTTKGMTTGTDQSKTVELKAGGSFTSVPDIGGLTDAEITALAGATEVTVTYDHSEAKVTVTKSAPK